MKNRKAQSCKIAVVPILRKFAISKGRKCSRENRKQEGGQNPGQVCFEIEREPKVCLLDTFPLQVSRPCSDSSISLPSFDLVRLALLPKTEYVGAVNARLIVLDWLSYEIPLTPWFSRFFFLASCIRSSLSPYSFPPHRELCSTRHGTISRETSPAKGVSGVNSI